MSKPIGNRKSPTPSMGGSDGLGGVNAEANPTSTSTSSGAGAGENTNSARGSSNPSSAERMAMQISSDEINVLIYRYLQEAGMSLQYDAIRYWMALRCSNPANLMQLAWCVVAFAWLGCNRCC
jgi:hypothetical protein